MTSNTINIKDFINSDSAVGVGYKDYWKESNIDKNVFLPHEQLMTIERRIIWAASKIGMANINSVHKTPSLSGEVLKYHISGEASIQDSIKGLAADYKRQPAVRLLKGIGNMGTHAGDPGAAARYTSVRGTPLLRAIIKDIKHVPMFEDETGLEQPKYLSTPLPMTLINGMSNIGTGHSAYYDERDAREVIDWIENLVDGKEAKIPEPISSSGCRVYKDKKSGYTYYEAVVKREGRNDIITNLPPKISSGVVIANLEKKLPARYSKRVMDASEDGKPVYIMVPAGSVPPEDYSKYSMRRARKETPYIWDEELDTMRMSSHEEIAMAWYNSRKEVIGKRINHDVKDIESRIERIDLVYRYYSESMQELSADEITEKLGEKDAEIVLSQPARAFLKENIDRSQKEKENLIKTIEELKSKNIKDLLFKEARDIIKEQEEYFAGFVS